MMVDRRHRIAGGGGTELHVVEAGNPSGPPMVFIHGYCQSTYAWRRQFAGGLGRDFRLVAFDLRGHGRSAKSLDPQAYGDGELWAADVAAVLERLDLRRAIVVAWSYGGFLVADYLRFCGQERIAAIALAACRLSVGERRRFIGEGYLALFPALFSNELSTLAPAMETFTDLCTARPLSEEERLATIGAAMLVPAVAREAMQRRKMENDDVLARISVPVLLAHGARDAVVLPSTSEHNASVIPGARLSSYPEAGHTTFVEDPERFDRELRELAAAVA